MREELLFQGDEVLSVTSRFIAIKRANMEVDLVPFVFDSEGNVVGVDLDHIATIAYTDKVTITEDEENGVMILDF